MAIDMGGPAARITHKKNAVVFLARMRVCKKGIRAFNFYRKVVRHKQIEDAIYAVGSNAFAARLGKVIGDLVSRCGTVVAGKFEEHRLAHIGPLLTTSDQSIAREHFKSIDIAV